MQSATPNSQSEASPTSIDLSGHWKLVDDSGEYSIPMAVPGDAISALFDAGVIPDPYFGCNEHEVRWVATRDWTLSRRFSVERLDYDLYLNELDTLASIKLNGKVIATTCNEFRAYRFDLSTHLQVGENLLEILFPNAIKSAAELQSAQAWRIPYQKENSPLPNGNMLRKVQCDFGWDWNIALAPFGLYGKCELQLQKTARIESLLIEQQHDKTTGQVVLEVTPELCFSDEVVAPVTLHFSFNGELIQQEYWPTKYRPTKNNPTVSFTVSSPKLWWPSGSGEQHLYDLQVRLDTQIEQRYIGLRTIELVTEPDGPITENATGTSFFFKINGEALFMRGANWIPADALPGRITDAKTQQLLQSAVDANMNMIRVWGGGRYERESFYHSCDKMGLLVWQDFMFSCNLYPADNSFLYEVEQEVRFNVSRLHHHASIALWCGDNELIGALNWFEESIKNRDRYLVSYDRLNRLIESTLKDTYPSATWWPSSPSPGLLNFGDAWHDDSSGDMHYWSVWHEGKDFSNYREVSPRFCSEFGFQSWPSLAVVKSFAPQEDFNIASPVMENHQKNAGGNARIAETLFRNFRFPEGFANSLYMSQVQQGLAIKTAVDHWRGLQPRCMGTLYWQLNDTWPVASWSSLDYGGGWKLLHHMARRFYSPINIVAMPVTDESDTVGWTLRGVNDLHTSHTVHLKVSAVNLDGERRNLSEYTNTLQKQCSKELLTVMFSDFDKEEFIHFEWQSVEGLAGSDLLARAPYKHYSLQSAGLTFNLQPQNGDWLIDISCEKPALFVALEANQAGQFSDNAFHVFADRKTQIRFTPQISSHAAATPPRLLLRDLHSASHSPITNQTLN